MVAATAFVVGGSLFAIGAALAQIGAVPTLYLSVYLVGWLLFPISGHLAMAGLPVAGGASGAAVTSAGGGR